mgnify:CR=1 FL=1
MTQDIFKKFIQLIEFDQSIQVIEKELERLVVAHEVTQKTMHHLLQDYDKEKIDLRDLQKQVDQEELMMRTYDEKEKAARLRLDAALNPKEYQALKKEHDSCKSMQYDHEQVLMNAWNAYESKKKQLVIIEQNFLATTKKSQLESVEQEEKIQAHKAHIAKLVNERESYVNDVPEEWIAKYLRMRSTVKNPVVGVVSGTCGGCSYMLSNQLLLALTQNRVMQCTGCYRLLYKHFDQAAV